MAGSSFYDLLPCVTGSLCLGTEHLSELNLFYFGMLYAEIHYNFKYFISLIKRRRPEIIADVPPRIGPEKSFPLLLIIKDSHRYPICLDMVKVKTRLSPGNRVETLCFAQGGFEISEIFREIILEVPMLEVGVSRIDLQVSVRGKYLKSGKQFNMINDNYPGGFRGMFNVRVAKGPLPAGIGWICGDIHCHSRYTDDQVEFGAGLEGLSRIAASSGYSWVGVTDHSYDLDDLPDDYLRNDPSLTKWKCFIDEVEKLNSSSGRDNRATLIPGEEVSCGNSRGRNVHLLVLGNRQFIPGHGDSAENWLQTSPTLPFDEILDSFSNKEFQPAAFAAHPFQRMGIIERLLFNRSQWLISDLTHKKLDGWQLSVPGNEQTHSVMNGVRQWYRQLLRGARLSLVSGSDSHGNFGVERSIGVPFLWIRVNRHQKWARSWTLVRTGGDASIHSVVSALRGGRTVLSSGPFVNLTLFRNGEQVGQVGDMVEWTGNLELEITAFSSDEFGTIKEGFVYLGITGALREQIIWRLDLLKKTPKKQIVWRVPLPSPRDGSQEITKETRPWSEPGQSHCGYIRGWVKSFTGQTSFEAWTSPVWLSKSTNS